MSGTEDFLARRAPPELRSPLGPAGRAPAEEPYDFDHAVYVIWRPWETCFRCRLDLKEAKVTLPDVGDYVCPHTMMAEYKALLAKRTKRLCELASHESTTLKNGVIQVSVAIAWRRQKESKTDASDAAMKGGPPRPPINL